MLESPGEANYYFPLADVRQDLLHPSEHVEKSGYRGVRRFWHLQVGDKRVENAVWLYPDPIPEAPKLKGTLAFWPEKDKRIEILVDGERAG